MSATTITSNGKLINEQPTNGVLNPWECHYYEHQIKYTEDLTNIVELIHISWTLEGDIPVGISIDNATGLISGIIKFFPDQPSCQDNFPFEPMKHDGSNYTQIGRFKHQYYDFDMSIKRTYKTTDGTTDPNTGGLIYNTFVASNLITIREVKNNDLDNYLFCYYYLLAKESEQTFFNEKTQKEETEVIQHKMKIGNDDYTIDNFGDFILNHPGPFVTDCGN